MFYLQILGVAIFLIAFFFFIINNVKYKKFIKNSDVQEYEGVIESVEIKNDGFICNVRMNDSNELIKVDNMDSIVISDYVPGYGTSKDYNMLINKKVKFSKDGNGNIEYDIVYKRKNEICRMYMILGLVIFIVFLFVGSALKPKNNENIEIQNTTQNTVYNNVGIKSYQFTIYLKNTAQNDEIQSFINYIRNLEHVEKVELQPSYTVENIGGIINITITGISELEECEEIKNSIENSIENNEVYKDIVQFVSGRGTYNF